MANNFLGNHGKKNRKVEEPKETKQFYAIKEDENMQGGKAHRMEHY